jgi:pimeloyl-ACP methyl ester carboxylesterase
VATYAIVHGAGDAGANWDLVAAELRERDHEVVAPDLPADDESAGLSEYTDTVVEAIGDRTELVLVAHSLGGFTAPLVCARVPVDLLVLVAGMVPAPGEKAGEWWANTGHGEAYDARWKDDEIALFLQDAPPDLAAAALEKSRDQAATPMLEPWPLDAWPEVATRYLLCREDRVHPADWARRMVRERLGIEADEIDGGHMPYVSRPKELAERLEAYRIENQGEREWVSR